MKKYDKLIYNIVKNTFILFMISTLLLLLYVLFMRNFNNYFSIILGIIYLIIGVITLICFCYTVVCGFLLTKKDNKIKELLVDSFKDAIFAVIVLLAYYLLFYKTVIISSDWIIILVFFLIPSFINYFEYKKEFKKHKK